MRKRIGIPDEMTAELMTERLWGLAWGRSAISNHTFCVEVYANLLFKIILQMLLSSGVIGRGTE